MATRIPAIVYPVAFAGALVVGRVVRGGGPGPASDAADAPAASPTTDDDGWGGFDSSGTQFPGGGGGGVLPTPIDGGGSTDDGSTGGSTGGGSSTVTDINGAAPDRIGVRPAGASGWVVVSGRAPFYTKKADGTYSRTYRDVKFSAWVGTLFSAKGSFGTAWVARILSGSHANQIIGTGSVNVGYVRG